MTRRALTPLERVAAFYAFIDPQADGCWLWTGGCDGSGYGGFWTGGRMVKAHRVSFELHVGPIAAGMQIDHLCRVRREDPLHPRP